ncbi:hypothetical protein YPPY54_3392, partial [Yersinia pestis PY-54]
MGVIINNNITPSSALKSLFFISITLIHFTVFK